MTLLEGVGLMYCLDKHNKSAPKFKIDFTRETEPPEQKHRDL